MDVISIISVFVKLDMFTVDPDFEAVVVRS
jgi:hypothetical protein